MHSNGAIQSSLTRTRMGARRQSGTGPLVAVSRVIDVLIVAGGFSWVFRTAGSGNLPGLVLATLVAPVWMYLFDHFGFYESHRLHGLGLQTRQLASAQLTGSLFMAVSAFLVYGPMAWPLTGLFILLTSAVLLAEKTTVRFLLVAVRRKGFDQRAVCFVGPAETARETALEFTRNAEWGLQMTMLADGPPAGRAFVDYATGQVLGGNLEEACRQTAVDEVWIAVPLENLWEEQSSIAACERLGLLGRVLVFSASDHHGAGEHAGAYTVDVGGLRHNEIALAFKRAFDVLLTALCSLPLLPLMVAAAVLVKLSSPGPVIFRQTRVGLRGRKFTIYKFRTMVDGAESMTGAMQGRNITRGPVFKDPQDWRITPIGRVLRRFSIDELPQLWNVIKGDMSLVGPRPLPVHEAIRITGLERKRFSMRPGLTCFWQVSGRSNVEYQQWMRYDLQYVEGWSFWLDLRLIARTVPVVFTGRGAY